VDEIAPGIWHWTSEHPRWGIVVHSYHLPAEGVVIDPLASPEILDRLQENGPPTAVLLTNRHHYRSSGELAERFGATVRCSRAGLHEFTHGEQVEPFDFGDELPGGIVVHEVGAICPDESALHIPRRRALALADGAVRMEPGGPLAFVPDQFMDDPEGTKEGLRESYRRLAELDFEHLLLAHGDPIVGDGREALRTFANAD
jgi:metallo-beta-lactamase superfamily protein